MSDVADLFRRDSRVAIVLRWMVYEHVVTAQLFKQAHVELGCTTNRTHAFDRYFEGLDNGYVPRAGSHAVLRRIPRTSDSPSAKAIKSVTQQPRLNLDRVGISEVRWIGSKGDTFEERGAAWLAKLSIKELDRAFQTCERHAIETGLPSALAWLRAAELACAAKQPKSPPELASAAFLKKKRMSAVPKVEIDLLVRRTEDAWSVDSYNSWRAVAAALLRRGYSPGDAEEIMRSKITRWAAERSDARGKASAKDVLRYIDRYPTCLMEVLITRPLRPTAETF